MLRRQGGRGLQREGKDDCKGIMRAGQSFKGHRPISNRLGACFCMDLASHNGFWALILVPKRASNDSKRGQYCHYTPVPPSLPIMHE